MVILSVSPNTLGKAIYAFAHCAHGSHAGINAARCTTMNAMMGFQIGLCFGYSFLQTGPNTLIIPVMKFTCKALLWASQLLLKSKMVKTIHQFRSGRKTSQPSNYFKTGVDIAIDDALC